MKKFLGLLILFVFSNTAFGQGYQADFQKHCQTNDTIKQREILTTWEKADPNNPELFTSYFNYYFLMSRREVVRLTTDRTEGGSLMLKDSLNNTAGFLGSEIYYDSVFLQKGIDKIDKGIALYPNRLDMRFGKIYVLGQAEGWEKFTDEIVKTVQYSSANNNRWEWSNNEKPEGGKEFFLSALQDYQLQLYNSGRDDLLPNMQRIASEVLKYYPDHIESLSNLAITYLLAGEHDQAVKYLLRAEKINPEDCIVLSNIAHAYKLKGNKKKAIQYYEKTSKYGDVQAKAFAQQQIKELKK